MFRPLPCLGHFCDVNRGFLFIFGVTMEAVESFIMLSSLSAGLNALPVKKGRERVSECDVIAAIPLAYHLEPIRQLPVMRSFLLACDQKISMPLYSLAASSSFWT